MLVSIEPARARGVDLQTFECAVCNQVLTSFAAFEDPMKSKGPWTLASRRFAPTEVRPAGVNRRVGRRGLVQLAPSWSDLLGFSLRLAAVGVSEPQAIEGERPR